mgnify:CR=1 FL=1
MIVTVLLTAALILTPVESNINDGSDGWMDYPNVVQKGEKHLPTTISFYKGPEYKKKWNKCRLQIRQSESRNVYGAMNRSKKYKGAYQMSPRSTQRAGVQDRGETKIYPGAPLASVLSRLGVLVYLQ